MTGLKRLATKALIYSALRTTARPPQIILRPRNLPLSRFNGARPTKADIFFPFTVPNSGKSLSRVIEVFGPTPTVLRRISSLSRQRGFVLIQSLSFLFTLSMSFSNQPIWAWISLRIEGGDMGRRFFSAVHISTSWRRRLFSASSSCASGVGRGRTSGRTASAKRAMIWASILSVLARVPVALAKSRICRGFISTGKRPRETSARMGSTSNPPAASKTISWGLTAWSHAAIWDKPSSLCANLLPSPLGRMATSRVSLDTSIPTKHSEDFIGLSPSTLPCKRCGIQNGPWQLFGLLEKKLRGDPSSPTSSRPKGVTAYPEDCTIAQNLLSQASLAVNLSFYPRELSTTPLLTCSCRASLRRYCYLSRVY